LNLFYNKNITTTDTQVLFDKEESRHIGKVLRKQEGDILDLTNGTGYFFKARLIVVTPKQCVAEIVSSEIRPQMPYHLHLAVAPTKLNDRFEWFLEKATEIGISEITPVICDHSERKVIRPERYEKIIVSAMKQSVKAYLPVLNPAVSYDSFINSEINSDTQKFIAHCEDDDKQALKSILKPQQAVLVLIGPEGDFSTSEIKKALDVGYKPVSLGESRLRTETAAIVACHSVAFVNEDIS